MDMSDIQGDETVSLSDVLVARDTCLPEDELWALCRECCLVLEVVNNSPDMFLTLCVTPDTVAFDQVGNVCFLDLDVDPEPIYLPPEYSDQGNTYKAHLFSLGMTLLYAAEYNVNDTKEAVSAELREHLGHMTADDPANRPDLESTINLCEEQLCGQSSQEVCCGIAAVVGFGLPNEDNIEGSVLESFVTDTGGSPDDFSHAESYVQSDFGDTTYCDDIPDLTEDISQAESLPVSEQETVVVTETTESHDDSLPLSEEIEHDLDLKQKLDSSTLKDINEGYSTQQMEQSSVNMKDSNSNKPAIPKKPDIMQNVSGAKPTVVNGVKPSQPPTSGELIVSELFSESESDQSRVDSDKAQVNGKLSNSSNSSSGNSDNSRKRERSKEKRSGISGSNKKEVSRDSNQNITYMKHEEKTTKESKDNSNVDMSVNKDMVLETTENGILIDNTEPNVENGSTKTRKSKRKQGLTISDILDALERSLTEPELWALCKEGTMALQRKKKHLPAYLSPDTLVVRESGNLSFKAIPEEKPLEVIFMAPELQKMGELSEKTCLFGLSVTLRCAAGKKYSSVSAMSVSSELKDLLQYLADSNPVRRPELVDIAKICNEHNNGTSSDGLCSKLFLEAFKAMNEKEEKANQASVIDKQSAIESSIKPTAFSAFKPPGGSSFQPVKPAPIGGSSGAFAPVPKKKSPNADHGPAEPRIPSAFSSPATHFKPIILQQTLTPSNEKPVTSSAEKTSTSKEKPKQSPKQSSSVASPKRSSPDPNADKEKEVVKKLKELKKNLMKHKQPSMAKEIENEDKASDVSNNSKSSASNKKSLPQTPKKSNSQSGERSRKRKGSTGALDALLKEIQKQGNVPDTHSLASAIAGYLQNHLNQSDSAAKSENQTKPASDLDMTVTSAQSALGQGQVLPDLNIPSQYHSQLLGQTMTLPPGVQYGGNVYSGLPQFQFQQDPVTGYLQLVPVNVVPMRPQSVHSNSGSVHSVREFTSPTGSGNLKDLNSPDMSPKTHHNQSDNQSAISDQSGSRGKVPHGRTAKDLVQKTANVRAKNLGRPSPSHLQAMSRDADNLQKWKSDHTLDRSEAQFYSDSERFPKHGSYSSLSFSNKLSSAFVYDDSVLNSGPCRSVQMPGVPRPHSQYGHVAHNMRSPEDMHRHNLNSTTSSPSPSTHDSGIGGMNHGIYRGNGPGSDASLMERLLNSNANVKQQRILGKLVHILREEFAFDGYMENGVEDLAMAEYICSIGVLKWETFKSAISEKYNDLYWHDEVLRNLYAAVNGGRPSSGNRSNSGQSRGPVSQRPRPSGNHDDDSSGHSERDSSRKKSHERLKPNFSPIGQGIAEKGNTHLDTSDSTDTENYSKRRRIKTKHELDKMKSSSNSSLLADNLQPMNGSVNTVPTKSMNNSSVVPTNSLSVSNSSSLPRNPNRQPTNSDMHSNFNTLPKQTIPSISQDATVSKPPKPNTDTSISQCSTKTNQNKSTVNGLSSLQASTENVSQGLSRELSMSSHSSSQSDLIREGEGQPVEKRGHVAYHWAMIQLCRSNEIEKFMQGIDEQNRKLLVTKLSALSQEIKMEKRSRRKTQKFYRCLVDNNKSVYDVSKNDKTTKEKNQLLQVAKDITEMTRRIGFVDLCKTHLQMLLAELQGIDVSYLYSISVCAKDEPLQLHPKPENPLLQFQTLREPHTGYEIQALHAGTPDGLMAYLFASTALSDGFIHQFLYCYRYFTTATEVLDFLIYKYGSATKSGSTETNISRLQERVVDLLHYWLEGYYTIDFKGKQGLINTLRTFIRDHIQDDSEGGQSLLSLLSSCCSGGNLELSSADPDEAEMHFWQTSEPKVKTSQTEKKKEWESLKSLIRGKSNAKDKTGKVTISAVCVERRRRSTENPDAFPIGHRGRRTDTFMLADYTAQSLAEQLCLIEQGIFQLTHPVHYLDSKSRGVGVALTMKGMKTPAMARRSGGEEGHGLFVEALQDSIPIQKMIDHAQEVSHWVAGEIVACSNSKTQVAILSKFLFIAHACVELRNFATSMAILDGLENLIIKQLPAWKNLPSKCSAFMDELSAVRMFLKNDPLSLMQQGKECHLYPTIPSLVIFLLHVQQLEIGGFKLANQMFKWGKIRSICQVIDQIRVYREHMYGFEADHNLQDTLRQRIHEMSEQEIHDLAVQHDMNYQKMSSGSGISGAFKKMKGKFK